MYIGAKVMVYLVVHPVKVLWRRCARKAKSGVVSKREIFVGNNPIEGSDCIYV